jgi:hypothetical protein
MHDMRWKQNQRSKEKIFTIFLYFLLVVDLKSHTIICALCTVKMVHEFPVSRRDVTNQTPPGQEEFSYDVIIPARESLVVTSRLGTGNSRTFFYGVATTLR